MICITLPSLPQIQMMKIWNMLETDRNNWWIYSGNDTVEIYRIRRWWRWLRQHHPILGPHQECHYEILLLFVHSLKKKCLCTHELLPILPLGWITFSDVKWATRKNICGMMTIFFFCHWKIVDNFQQVYFFCGRTAFCWGYVANKKVKSQIVS
jgi:hypothetical protein